MIAFTRSQCTLSLYKKEFAMLKNITLTAEESLIRKARQSAQQEHTTLNAIFRQWLTRYVRQTESTTNYESLMQDLSYARASKHYSRDEMNER